MECPQCRHDNPPAAKFCHECGGALSRRCSKCGASLTATMKFCGECGAALGESRQRPPASPDAAAHESEARARPATETGERRQLTVLFSDLVGSTELSTKLDPEEWRDRVAQYHRVTAEVVT